MFNQLKIRVKTHQFQLYSEYFSFFHSNSINKILTSKKIDQVILYRDLQFLDDQTQYLKRTYYQTQAYNRIKKLISYYQKNMTPPSPISLCLEQYQYLDNRNRKILKLCIMKEKSQGQKEKRKSFIQSNNLKGSNTSAMADILHKLEETNLENIVDSDRDESEEESYDSDVHDVFENWKDKPKGLYGEVDKEYKQVLAIRNIKESSLVINFKTVNEPPSDCNNIQNQPKITVTEPQVTGLKFNSSKNLQKQQKQQEPPSSKQSSTIQQTSSPLESITNTQPQQPFQAITQNYQQGNIYQQNGANGHYQQNQGLNNQNIMMGGQNGQYGNAFMIQQANYGQNPQYPQQSQFANNPNFNQNSVPGNFQYQQPASSQPSTNTSNNWSNSNFNPLLPNNLINSPPQQQLNNASSPKPQNKGKLSFMEYYHSVPVKNPTNLLEKYMKRKK